jgi:hypothetical protein
VSAQARHLVDHLLSSGNCWGKLYQEALWKAWRAEHASNEERWYNAIVSEMRLRGWSLFSFSVCFPNFVRFLVLPFLPFLLSSFLVFP